MKKQINIPFDKKEKANFTKEYLNNGLLFRDYIINQFGSFKHEGVMDE